MQGEETLDAREVRERDHSERERERHLSVNQSLSRSQVSFVFPAPGSSEAPALGNVPPVKRSSSSNDAQCTCCSRNEPRKHLEGRV